MRWAELLASLRAAGRVMPIKDSLIAATALANDLAIATRNVADFSNADVEVVDPFAASGRLAVRIAVTAHRGREPSL